MKLKMTDSQDNYNLSYSFENEVSGLSKDILDKTKREALGREKQLWHKIVESKGIQISAQLGGEVSLEAFDVNFTLCDTAICQLMAMLKLPAPFLKKVLEDDAELFNDIISYGLTDFDGQIKLLMRGDEVRGVVTEDYENIGYEALLGIVTAIKGYPDYSELGLEVVQTYLSDSFFRLVLSAKNLVYEDNKSATIFPSIIITTSDNGLIGFKVDYAEYNSHLRTLFTYPNVSSLEPMIPNILGVTSVSLLATKIANGVNNLEKLSAGLEHKYNLLKQSTLGLEEAQVALKKVGLSSYLREVWNILGLDKEDTTNLFDILMSVSRIVKTKNPYIRHGAELGLGSFMRTLKDE